MVDPYAIVRRLTGYELISPKDVQLLTEAVDGLIGEIGSKDARIAELEAEVERLKQELAATQEKLIKANDELIQRRAEALSRTGAVKVELSGNTGELIDKMAEAIRGDTTSNETPWATLSEDRKIGWRGDAERALAVVKEYLTARRPTERAVTEAMVEAAVQAVRQYTRETLFIDEHRELVRAALKAAMEAGR